MNRSRLIPIIGLFQVLTVVVGMLAARIILKMSGYPDDATVRWNPAAVFLRNSGSILLLFPVLWTPLAVAAENHLARAVVAAVLHAMGAAILIGLFLFCCWACTHFYTRPIWILR